MWQTYVWVSTWEEARYKIDWRKENYWELDVLKPAPASINDCIVLWRGYDEYVQQVIYNVWWSKLHASSSAQLESATQQHISHVPKAHVVYYFIVFSTSEQYPVVQ
jgi:hypothetical protein